MNLDEKSEKIKEELEKLGEEHKFTVNSPKSLDEHTKEWQYSINYERPDGLCENININVHKEYIDVYSRLSGIKRFKGINQVDDALEWVKGFFKNPKQASDI